MDREQIFHYSLVVLVAILLYLGFRIVQPFGTSIIVSFILAYLVFPVYRRIRDRWERPQLASGVVVTLTILTIVIPTLIILVPLFTQSIGAFQGFLNRELTGEQAFLGDLLTWAGLDKAVLSDLSQRISSFFVGLTPRLISSIAEVFIGLFVMFFIMFYALLDGERWFSMIKHSMPLEHKYKERLFYDVQNVTRAVLYGQFLTAVIQGAAGGLMLFLFGIGNPIFWGFLMIVLGFLPVIGTPVVWLPIAIVELVSGRYVSGIGILVIGGVIVMNIDNIVRPRLIGSRANISTPLVLLGVLGGLRLFGLPGLVLGPLILAMLQTALALYHGEPLEAVPEHQK